MSRQDPKIDAKIGEVLVSHNQISAEDFGDALLKTREQERSLIEVLSEDYSVSEDGLYEILSKEARVPFAPLREVSISSDALARTPVKVASHYGFMPIRISDGKLMVAVDYPLNLKMQDEIRFQLGMDITQVLSRKSEISQLFRQYYGLGANTVDRIVTKQGTEVRQAAGTQHVESIDKMAGDASVVNLVNEIIYEALQKRATDVHLEPYRGEFRVRYRIDGILNDVHLPPKALSLISAIISRIKLMANLDIIEKRLPQDGRAIVKVKNQNLDLRISCIPTPHGESIVIRVLPTQMIFDMKKLGLSDKNIELLDRLIHKPNGILLWTGPTGSGKTTTLYACLQKINSKEKKIVTIEDPVEYEIPGITQIQVLPKVGFDFAKGLRSVLRHDPDVLMVGEIRDFETAEIAMRAALTGHLVFSTLHTNDAASGVTRLLDIGLEPFLVASSVEAIIAQRLVRTICTKCKVEDFDQPFTLKKKIAADLKLKSTTDVRIYKGKGCEACGHTGHQGRTAIHEILVISENIKDMISKKMPAHDIKTRAVKEGMLTLLQDGWQKVLAGVTTPGEVINVVHFIHDENTDSSDTLSPFKSGNEDLQAYSPDQRAYERLDAKMEVTYARIEVQYRIFSEKNSEQTLRQALTENISASGLLIKTREAFEIGTILEIHFQLNKADSRVVKCLSRVVRMEEGSERYSYYAGVMFLDLSSSDKAHINEYVARYKSNEEKV